MNENEVFSDLFAPESALSTPPANADSWKVLLVDDEPAIHAALQLALRDVVVEGHALQLLDALSAAQAKVRLAEHPDIALILLDVVMESELAGLEVVRHIRDDLGNPTVQIVLITGQPGHAPQREVIATYDINAYVLKSALTSENIFVSVYGALRTHRALRQLEQQHRQLEVQTEALRESEELLKSMTAAVPGVVYQFAATPDGEWKFLYLSKGIEDLYEVTAQEAYRDHRVMTNCIVAEDRTSHREAVERSALTLSEWTHEHRIKTRSGRLKWVLGVAIPARQEDGSTLWNGILTDVTDRVHMEQQLQTSQERLQLALSGGDMGLWDWSIPSGEVLYSEHWFSMLGLPSGEKRLDLESWIGLIHPDDLASVKAALDSHLKGQTPAYECEHRVRHQDGRWLWLHDRGKVVEWDQAGAPIRAVGTYSEITQRKQSELELARSKNRYEGILHNMMDAYWRVDAHGRIMEVNPAICRMLGYSKEELLKMSISDFDVIESEEDTRKHVVAIQREGRDFFESQHRCRDGRIVDVEICANLASDAPGNIDSFHRDVTERKKMERHVRELAFHDALTKLPNRRLLNDRLTQAMAAGKRSGFYGALMFLDLDNFKPLNDAHGHKAGDMLLVEAAERLKACVREMDTVSRFGGDEYVVMISELVADEAESTEQARNVAEKIRIVLSQPYQLTIRHDRLDDTTVIHHCTASIGVALFKNHDESPDEILKWADAAMYQAKQDGRNLIRFHEPGGQAP